MIKLHRIEKVVLKEVIDDVICNCCGNPIKKNYYNNDTLLNEDNFCDFDDYAVFYKKWNYFSNYDSEIHSFDICQSCYKKWIDSFKIPIEIEEVKY